MEEIKLVIGDSQNYMTFRLREKHGGGAFIEPSELHLDWKYLSDEAECCPYLHLESEPTRPATEGERRLLAQIYLADAASRWEFLGVGSKPEDGAKNAALRAFFASPPSPGRTVMMWAFPGMTPQDVSAKYGTGATIFIA